MSYSEERNKEIDNIKLPLTKVQRTLIEMRLWTKCGYTPKDTAPMNDKDLLTLLKVLSAVE